MEPQICADEMATDLLQAHAQASGQHLTQNSTAATALPSLLRFQPTAVCGELIHLGLLTPALQLLPLL